MNQKILEDLKKNKREDWLTLLKEKWTDGRIWIQEHGEWALGIGFLAGVIVVLAFELVVALVVVAILLGVGIWYFAGTNEEEPALAKSASGDSSAVENSSENTPDSKPSNGPAETNFKSNGPASESEDSKDSLS